MIGEQLALLKGHEDAVLFPCGFSANVAVAAVLAADDDVHIFSDELNHASIIDGLRLATRAKVSTFSATVCPACMQFPARYFAFKCVHAK